MVCFRNNPQELNLGLLQIGGTGPRVSRSRFKAFKEESEVEDCAFAVTLRNEELLDRDNCMWLSISGASSPSSCCKDNGLFSYMDLKIDAWFISLLSTQAPTSDTVLSTKVAFFDGSRVNPIEEASLVLDQRKKQDETTVFQENLEEEEVVLWLKNELYDDGSECHSQTLEKRSKSKLTYFTDSSDDHEQSLFSSSSSSDYSSEVMDLEEISTNKPLFWPLNSSSDWGSETQWDYFIMSPRKDTYRVGSNNLYPKAHNQEPNLEQGCNRRLVFGTRFDVFDLSNKQGMNDSKRINNEAHYVALEDTKIRTPVFWPSNYASEWDFNAKWDILTISPRKDVYYRFGKSPNICLDSHENMDIKNGCKRRIEFSRDSKPPSNMTKSANTIATERAEVDRLTKPSLSKQKIVLEDLLLVDKLNEEGAIEQVLGLDEFDGHEGLESEFNKDDFSPWFC